MYQNYFITWVMMEQLKQIGILRELLTRADPVLAVLSRVSRGTPAWIAGHHIRAQSSVHAGSACTVIYICTDKINLSYVKAKMNWWAFHWKAILFKRWLQSFFLYFLCVSSEKNQSWHQYKTYWFRRSCPHSRFYRCTCTGYLRADILPGFCKD